MNNMETHTEEIVIVGSRYGELADVVNPLYEQGLPVEPEDIKEKLGGDVVYLTPVNNSHDAYAVGVYSVSQKRIGHVWMHQAPALRQWLDENHKKYVCAHIRRMNTQYRLMMATPDKPMKLEACERSMMGYDPDWAKNLPEELKSITTQSLSLGMALLHDELEEARAWSPRLRQRIDNLLRYLPADLSAHHYKECMELYEMMKASEIAEVRQQSDMILHAFVSRGSEEQMRWWMNCWLPDFFRETAESDLLGLFEAANYTLDDVETLLRRAPENLFYLYKANRFRFVNHLYYSALPQNIYNRLLTLLAVREAMLGKKEGRPSADAGSENQTATDRKIRHACQLLQQEKVLKKKSDWGLIMTALNQTELLPSYDTPRSFVEDFGERLHIDNVPSESTVSKMVGKTRGMFPKWMFDDTTDNLEVTRRINVGKRFVSIVLKKE